MHRFPDRLRPFTVLLVAAAVAVLCASWPVAEGGVDLIPLVVLGAVAVAAGRQRVQFAPGVEVTPGFMVSMAAIVVYHGPGIVAAPMIVAALTAVTPRHLPRHTRGWLAFNAANYALSTAAAALVYAVLPDPLVTTMPTAILGVLPVAFTIGAVETLIVAASYRIEQGRSVRGAFRDFLPGMLRALPFAVVGLFLGRMFYDLGWPVVLLLVVPILMARDLFTSYLHVREANDATMRALIRALEAKDSYTAGHAERVARYAQYMGEEFGFSHRRLDRLHCAALMHDIGKLVVPNQLLNKPGRLTAEEYEIVRRHEGVSVAMLAHIDVLRPIAEAAGGDHSHFDPDDESSALEASIIAVADAYDAMTSTRSYRRALTQDVAFEELRAKAGTQFDPRCVEALIHAIDWRGERHGAGHEVPVKHWAVAPPGAGVGSAGLGDLVDGNGAS